MTSFLAKQTYIGIEYCKVCQGCCKAPKAEVICGYNLFEGIQNGKLSAEEIQKLLVFRVPEHILDDAAKNWGMFPLDNLLRHLTVRSDDGFWEFVALPSGTCPFLGEKGCRHPECKTYECGIYPFYVYKLELRYDYRCPYCDSIEEDCQIRSIVGKFISDFLLFSDKNKEEYAANLLNLKQKYSISVITLTESPYRQKSDQQNVSKPDSAVFYHATI